MSTHNVSRTVTVTLALLALCLDAPATAGGAAAEGGKISAIVLDTTGGPGRNTASLTLHVDKWSTDEEAARLAGVLKEKGPEALQNELEDLDYGWIRVGNSLGYPIAVARSLPQEDGGRLVRIVVDRPIAFVEAIRSLRSEDYPLSLIEIRFDAQGEGEGTLAAAVKAHFEGTQLVVETHGFRPFRVVQAKAR